MSRVNLHGGVGHLPQASGRPQALLASLLLLGIYLCLFPQKSLIFVIVTTQFGDKLAGVVETQRPSPSEAQVPCK